MFRSVSSTAAAAAAAAGAHAASSSSATPAARLLPSSLLDQRRYLSSTVLFTRTREEYDVKRVIELKDELRQRGLATSGKRDELVRRLLNDDVRRAGSNNTLEPAPGVSARSKSTQAATAAAPATDSSSLASLRAQSSSAPSSASPSKSKKAGKDPAVPPTPTRPPPAPTGSKDDIAATVTDTSKIISAGIAIDKQAAAEEAGGAPVAPGVSSPHSKQPVDSNPPGVPPEQLAKEAASSKTASAAADAQPAFDIKIPYETAKPQVGAEVPLVTSYFHPEDSIPEAVRAADEEYQSNPKVVAVGGSPHTAIAHHATDAAHRPGHSSQDDKHTIAGALSSILSDVRKDFGLPAAPTVKKAASDAASAAGARLPGASSNLEEATKAIRDALASVSESTSSGGSSGSSSSSGSGTGSGSGSGSRGSLNRPLTAEERTGAYLLGAIVFGGLLLGGIAAPADPEKKAKRAAKKKVGGAGSAASSSSSSSSSSFSASSWAGKPAAGGYPSPIEASDPATRERVNKALDDLVRAGGAGSAASSSSSADASSANFPTGQGIVGGGARKW